jgi:hypothetical protein
MSWVKEEIGNMKAEREWTLRKADILAGKRFLILSALCAQLKKDLSDLDSEYKGEVELTEVPAHTFTIIKKTSPSVSVTGSVRNDCRMIELLTRKLSSFGLPDEKADAIGVDMDEKENIRYFWFNKSLDSLEDVSRVILGPVIAAYRR